MVSYFIGNDPAKWHPDVPVWGGVRYKDLYPGMDLELTSENGHLVQHLVAQPDADLSAVRLRVEGADTVELLPSPDPSAPLRASVGRGVGGEGLRLATAVGDFTLPLLTVEGAMPDGQPATSSLECGTFEVTSPFSPAPLLSRSLAPLQDNPSDLLYSTFLGGSDDDSGLDIAVDESGAAYVTGYTRSSDFPTTPGAFDTSFNGGDDAFVVKLNAVGSALVYAAFLGGSNLDYGYAIAVDRAGSAYVTGRTFSSDFPTTPGAFDTTFNGICDAFVVRLNAAGSALAYATFLGGSSGEENYAIAVDGAGSAYVTGVTGSDFPSTPGAFDTTHNGYEDAFVVKLNAAGSALVYATFLGGGDTDLGLGIVVDASGAAYVTGYTRSSDFPTTPSAFDTTFNGYHEAPYDAFVAKLNAAGSALVYATFLGGSSHDWGRGIVVDASGAAYVTGNTWSSDFPTTPGAFDTTFNGYHEAPYDAFVAKLNAAGSALVYATFLGGSSNDGNGGIAVDGSGAAYVTGGTGSSDFPTTLEAFDTTINGYSDAFVVKFNAAGSALVYATFLGGSSNDSSTGIAVDGSGTAYVTGSTYSFDFPTTPEAFDTTHNGIYDAFVAKLAVGGKPLVEPLSLTPLCPVSDLLPQIMQGGTVHQYFEVRDASGAPAPFVTVTFSPAGSGTSDANGLLDVAVNADALGGPGNYDVTSVGANRWGQTYALASAVNFSVEVRRRELTSFWGSGAAMRSRAGVNAGVIGYIKGAHEGGLNAQLTEQYPLSETDDTLRMTASQMNEAGGGVGLGAEAKFTAGPAKGSAGASVETGLTWKALEEYTSLFNDPYASEQQRAAAITALVGIYRTAQGFAQVIPGLNLLGQIILKMLEQYPDYRNYLDEETIGTGVALENSADIGGKLDLLRFGKYSHGIRRSRFLHLQAGAEFDAGLNTLMKWTTDLNTDATRALSWREETTASAWGGFEAGLTYGARAKWAREIGAVYSIERQADYASDGMLQKLVFTVSSETRNESQAGVDIDPLRPANINWGAIAGKGVQYQIQHRYIFEGDALTQALSRAPGLGQLNVVEQMASAQNPLQLGQMAAQRDLMALLGCSPTCLNDFTYEKWAVITTDLQPGLDLGFTLLLDLELSGNFKVQWGKEVLLERGPFFDGNFYPVEVYTLDSYVDAPERTLWSLIGQAVQAAFDTVSDFFNTVKEKIEAGKDWVIDVIARTREGIIKGGMRLIGAGGGFQGLRDVGSLDGGLQDSSTFTLTATAWVPTTNLTMIQQARLLGIQTTEASFVVGGVYDLQPYTQTLSPAATLVITYTDDAVAGRDESLFRLYRWEPSDNAWRPLADPVDTASNTVTTTITSLGTYAIGFDDQPPVIEEIIPGPDVDLATYRPDFRITLCDAGSGVDPDSLRLTVAGTLVTATFDPIQGLLWYSPTVAFANGVYTLSIQAADTTGNAITVTSPFTIAVPAPAVGGVSPNVIYQGITTTVAITGTGFYPGLALYIGDYTPPSVAYFSAAMLSVTMAPTSPLGIHAVTVTNPDGLSGTLIDGLIVTIASDVNGDCVVGMADIMLVANRWRTSCENPDPDNNLNTPSYDAHYDLDHDCDIDIVDIMLVAVHWGETCP